MLKKEIIAVLLVLQCSEFTLSIKVPIIWDESRNSEVKEVEEKPQSQVENFSPQRVPQNDAIPVEYFEYNAKKPQFAIDVAKFHGVQAPENHYKAYPVKPYTGVKEPHLGNHEILNEDREIHEPYQKYAKKNNAQIKNFLTPTSSSYEIFHPYKEEEPALQIIYKDPVLDKIRNDLKHSKDSHHNYVEKAANADINKAEYLESPEETDHKKLPQKNVPTEYEIHRSQHRPNYYKAPLKFPNRDNVLNRKFIHPWHQNYIKVRPKNYRPLRNHLQNLKQHHSLAYNDEHNEYPQPLSPEKIESSEGYDIYENAKHKFNNLRNNVDESINKAVQENKPAAYNKLEFQNNNEEDNNEEDEEFIPIKNYAQVRKTETTKHLPRQAALDDADSLDEIKNAPRLREAIKSTKAQTVYTEEGYEDAAYDHAGEQKHASDHEGHGGYLKQHELSQGKFKIPSVSAKYSDAKGNIFGDNILHKENWNNDNKDKEEEIKSEDFTENEQDESIDAEIYQDIPEDDNDTNTRNKRENEPAVEIKKGNDNNSTEFDHDVNKRAAQFKVPEINLNSTFLNENQILKLAKIKIFAKKDDDIKEKYPYYFKNMKAINKDSPLKYAENMRLIPKKSDGGTEFYDSRSKFLCPEVDDKLDPIPEKLKNGNTDSDDDEITTDNDKKNEGFEKIKENPRLKGLGDKIDCFKAKYFGENPLDSPFFKEDLIMNPEPVTKPSSKVFKLQIPIEQSLEANKFEFDKLSENISVGNLNIFETINNMRNKQNKLKESLPKIDLNVTSSFPQNKSFALQVAQQSNLYQDILMNIRNSSQDPIQNENIVTNVFSKPDKKNNTDKVTTLPTLKRKKRGTSFTYEPYKIIREGQIKDPKKTQTATAVSPLIKQLQSSKLIDKSMQLDEESQQPSKNNTDLRLYKNIGKKDREMFTDKVKDESGFVDVSVDPRRGEPRYELKISNHKSEYTPVENKKSMSVEDYETHINSNQKTQSIPKKKDLPYYNIASFLPSSTESQLVSSASKTVRRVIKTTTESPENNTEQILDKNTQVSISDEDGDELEYDDDEINGEEKYFITTTTTEKSIIRRKTRKLTTEKPQKESEKLKLVTRFHIHKTTERPEMIDKSTRNPEVIVGDHIDDSYPKYREKKKQSTMSTLVTDRKSYGNDDNEDDDMRKTEIDALIGVKQDMDDYIPEYEKEKRTKGRRPYSDSKDDEDEDEDDEDEDEDDIDDEENSDEDEDEQYEEEPVLLTTPEPTKRTLPKTTESPPSTTESHRTKIKPTPIIMKKKVEIHKELPINISSPHQTQFRQNIKEIEIVKESPPKSSQKKPQKDIEALELYKDDNLAKDINKLKDVEVFRENLNLETSPRHGGNYKSIQDVELNVKTKAMTKPRHGGNLKLSPLEDVEASQSESKKHIELDESSPKRLHGGNLKSIKDYQRARDSKGQTSKLIELKDDNKSLTPMHGGNLRSLGTPTRKQGRENSKSAKYIELDEESDDDDDSASGMHGGNFKPYGNTGNSRPMHGGNYRNSKLVQAEDSQPQISNTKSKPAQNDPRRNAAALLSGFAQAVPLLTTTPAYILDPSKRMYYYVEV